MSTKALMTAEQFAQMNTADTEDYELVDGELIPLSSGTPRHAEIRFRVERLIKEYLEGNPIGRAFGEIDCRLNPELVRRPDVSVFLRERLNEVDLDKTPAPCAPDIAVEVLSPSEGAIEVRRKVRDYLRSGSREVWLFDHANGEILLHTQSGIRVLQETDVLESPLLPGFSAIVADLLD